MKMASTSSAGTRGLAVRGGRPVGRSGLESTAPGFVEAVWPKSGGHRGGFVMDDYRMVKAPSLSRFKARRRARCTGLCVSDASRANLYLPAYAGNVYLLVS